jgi:hypothetical protein
MRAKRVFTFFDRFSPFPAVFESGADPELLDRSGRWCRAPFLKPLKNGENGKNGELWHV